VRLFLGLLAGCEQFLLPGCDENYQPIGGQDRIACAAVGKNVAISSPVLCSSTFLFIFTTSRIGHGKLYKKNLKVSSPIFALSNRTN
jgi:hypothetical protein